MDISDTLAPKSDQLDAVDLLGGERTFTISSVTANNGDQPINIHLTDFPRPWRPGLSMRRVLAACWGTNASKYVGRSVTLYCDPDVIFGKDRVGGTRIKALSDIDGTKRVPLLVARGRSAIYTVEPLIVRHGVSAELVEQWIQALEAASTLTELQQTWTEAGTAGVTKDPRIIDAKDARKAELS